MAKGQQRDLKREAFWRGVLARFDSSGLTVRGFCARERLTEPSFYAWRRVIQERGAEPKRAGRPAFVPVVLGDARPGDADRGIVLEVSGGPGPQALTLRLPAVMPVRQVAELVHALAAAQAPGVVAAEVRS